MNTVTLNMNIFLSNTGFTGRNNIVHLLMTASHEYVNIYSTCRVPILPPPPYLQLDFAIANLVWCKAYERGFGVGLYKILFYFETNVRINHPFIAPSHLYCSHYCNTIARLLRNIRCPPDPPFACHTPYNIANGNIV